MHKLLFCLLLLAWLPEAHAQKIEVPYTQFTLPNGLNVILHEDHTTPFVTVNLWYHVGSGRERPGRTGFAHLFEHIMFEGSGNVPEGKIDEWLEVAGGYASGTTNSDHTNYFNNVTSNALDLALFVESDRMGYLLDAMSPAKVDGQRDVVKNERRQTHENRPYGLTWIALGENLYPEAHPYHWPTIGYMDDLTAASYDDVVDFFKTYYIPNNASLVIAGDIDVDETTKLVHKWFGEISSGPTVKPIDVPTPHLTEEKHALLEDKVQLPLIVMAWLTPPAYEPGTAAMTALANVLASGKNSRLHKRLVHDLQMAQDVFAFQDERKLSSMFIVAAFARPDVTLEQLQDVIQEELDALKAEPPKERELQRAVNQLEASFLGRLQSIESKADQLNSYYFYRDDPGFFDEDLSRFKALRPNDLQAAARTYLRDDGRVILGTVPEGRTDLAPHLAKADQ